VKKIETLSDDSVFLGSGHLYTIAQCKHWAEQHFVEDARPDFSYYLEDPEDRGFSCLWISADGDTIILLDGEMGPTEVIDDFVAIGSGAAYALGAMEAGADVVRAVEIACERDPSTSAPIHTHTFED
jgi:ATP-dependent protease HslVU (ClpYQ) peptidase subunit